MINSRQARFAVVASIAAVTVSTQAWCQEDARREYHLPKQDLSASLLAIGTQSNTEILFRPEDVRNLTAPALNGRYSAMEAVREVVAHSGLVVQAEDGTIFVRGRSAALSTPALTGEIVITGSRIRGSEPVSPVVAASRADIEKRGFTDLGEFARDLVQNYSGGQNPGIASGGQGTSENVTSGSALNLRGLGPDATLTLFNSHRVPYDAIGQGVDISAIPLAAIERVEVITDGASALYGSDAVGGVANVILRRDFDGAIASARFGAATDGGDVEQQYNIVTGKRWTSGGVMAAFDYRDLTPITAGERSYTNNIYPTATLVAGLKQFSTVLTGHQRVADNVTFEFDGSYADRTSGSCTNFDPGSDCSVSGVVSRVHSKSWSISPSARFQMAEGWEFRLAGTIGESTADQTAHIYLDDALFQSQRALYTNRLGSIELGADGSLFELPGGEARLALGTGLRNVSFQANAVATIEGTTIPFYVFKQSTNTKYLYGEISLPLIASSNGIPGIERLSITGALRYEDVSHVGDVATPKIGLVYAPIHDVAFKFSWGKSFKAPTLFQMGQPQQGYSQIGASFVPASPYPGAILYLSGGNPDLKPEKATSWTATATFTPSFARGLEIQASYFEISYKDRVVNPIPYNYSAFSPLYSAYVTPAPDQNQIAAAIAKLPLDVLDQGGGDVTKTEVGAIVTNYLQNAARQKVKGIDISAIYAFDLGGRDKFNINAAASYLDSMQQLSPGQPDVQIAGTIYHPPHWRARSSIDWQRGNFALTTSFSYICGLLDNRYEPYIGIGSYKSVDAVARISATDQRGLFAGTSFTLSILNLFNEKPAYARSISATGYHYDSTNFPSIGRFVSLTATKVF